MVAEKPEAGSVILPLAIKVGVAPAGTMVMPP